ncbi:MAG: hypothetical protein KAS54_04805, partial [Dehalococcoidia bacterium]|nr:hypothetical protein [Dehalococcoidia bacterium]
LTFVQPLVFMYSRGCGDMSGHGLAIAGAAEALGIAEWTVRCHIRSGKIKADLVPCYYGMEYRISELSHVLTVAAGVDEALPSALDKALDTVKAI